MKVVEPISHSDLIAYVKKCKFVISDSGGLQEECSYLNKKIIVCRKTTERPESIGTHSFMCSEPEMLDGMVADVNNNYKVNEKCPYGNGKSWEKIKNSLMKFCKNCNKYINRNNILYEQWETKKSYFCHLCKNRISNFKKEV